MPRRPGSKVFARRLGARIRALREEQGLTQEKLAWGCDVAKAYMSQIEGGKRLPSIPVLGRVAKLLGVQLVDIVGFDLTDPRLVLLDATRREDKDAVMEALRQLGFV